MVHINEKTEENYVLIYCLYRTYFIPHAQPSKLTKICCLKARSAEIFWVNFLIFDHF